MAGAFLSVEDIDFSRNENIIAREDVRKNKIDFEFPGGFAEIPFIEQLRALQCMDWQTNVDSFDIWFDVMMQLLTEKPVRIMFKENENWQEIFSFVVTNRYMDLNGVALFKEYPILCNWMVAKVAYTLEKKFPRSLEDIQALKTDLSQPMNMQHNQEKKKTKMPTQRPSNK